MKNKNIFTSLLIIIFFSSCALITDEYQANQNKLNVAISSLLSEKTAVEENLSRLNIEIRDMDDRRLSFLSNESDAEKPSSDMQNLLKQLLSSVCQKNQIKKLVQQQLEFLG